MEAQVRSAEDLIAQADAAWGAGDYDTCIDARERAFVLQSDAGITKEAARNALRLRALHFQRGNLSAASGWGAAADRLLQNKLECAEHGLKEYGDAFVTLFFLGDLNAAVQHAQRAIDIGERHNAPGPRVLGMSIKGRALVIQGHLREGLALMDESMACALAGEVDSFTACLVYCDTISLCQEISDLRRAAEWTQEALRRGAGREALPLSGDCRVHRAGLMRARGAWDEAEAEASKCCEDLAGAQVHHVGEALFELAEIHFLRGDLKRAEEIFAAAMERSSFWSHPGLALLKLEQGDIAAAKELINAELATHYFNPLARARLLPAHVVISLAAGDVGDAEDSALALEELAGTFDTPGLRAAAACARGTVELHHGDPQAARQLKQGVQLWMRTGAPYEAAKARAALSQAYRRNGQHELARVELRAALAVFERLGATRDAAKASELIADIGGHKTDNDKSERIRRTFMFTDIVGSTALLEAMGDSAWDAVRRWHADVIRSNVTAFGGEVVKDIGDGFFTAFDEAHGAVEGAVAIQRALVAHRKAHGFAPQVRIGLHSAEAESASNGDYSGKAVNIAARLCAAAGANEILASTDTLGEFSYPAGERTQISLKGISEPLEVAAIDWERPG